jgi:hypothetical protein
MLVGLGTQTRLERQVGLVLEHRISENKLRLLSVNLLAARTWLKQISISKGIGHTSDSGKKKVGPDTAVLEENWLIYISSSPSHLYIHREWHPYCRHACVYMHEDRRAHSCIRSCYTYYRTAPGRCG